MHTRAVETAQHGTARIHFNSDMSGNVEITWGSIEVTWGSAKFPVMIPGEVFKALARVIVLGSLAARPVTRDRAVSMWLTKCYVHGYTGGKKAECCGRGARARLVKYCVQAMPREAQEVLVGDECKALEDAAVAAWRAGVADRNRRQACKK